MGSVTGGTPPDGPCVTSLGRRVEVRRSGRRDPTEVRDGRRTCTKDPSSTERRESPSVSLRLKTGVVKNTTESLQQESWREGSWHFTPTIRTVLLNASPTSFQTFGGSGHGPEPFDEAFSAGKSRTTTVEPESLRTEEGTWHEERSEESLLRPTLWPKDPQQSRKGKDPLITKIGSTGPDSPPRPSRPPSFPSKHVFGRDPERLKDGWEDRGCGRVRRGRTPSTYVEWDTLVRDRLGTRFPPEGSSRVDHEDPRKSLETDVWSGRWRGVGNHLGTTCSEKWPNRSSRNPGPWSTLPDGPMSESRVSKLRERTPRSISGILRNSPPRMDGEEEIVSISLLNHPPDTSMSSWSGHPSSPRSWLVWPRTVPMTWSRTPPTVHGVTLFGPRPTVVDHVPGYPSPSSVESFRPSGLS